MSEPNPDKSLEVFEEWLQKSVKFSSFGGDQFPEVKADILIRLLERLQIKRKLLERKVSFQKGHYWHCETVNGKLWLSYAESVPRFETGTHPVAIQARLLIFLLGQGGKRRKVFNLIEEFVHTVWDDWVTEDFEQTQTGVYRCFTNTRLAANRLREYGLLRYSEKERHKTWVLSLPGLLTAAVAYNRVSSGQHEFNRHKGQQLDEFIYSCGNRFKAYDNIVATLDGLLEPNAEFFESFGPILKSAHELLPKYWDELNDPDKSNKSKQDATKEICNRIHSNPQIDKFMDEASSLIQVEQVLDSIRTESDT